MKLLAILGIASLAAALAPPPVCEQCRPLPNENKCDITTSCVYVWGHKGSTPAPYYCACRAGYRATGYGADDWTKQWRLPWYGGNGDPSQEGRVFVKPGVKCDTLCDSWWLGAKGCQEVTLKDSCL
ncbi:uncharacterized protein BDR25DRAFT_79790 [Lindgomyces ingoldianus]|uniref:Uncharacterized protein n=1 Tax=Lindgomyces ingoldianus TaxID=673940 RepID=A0ACB6QGP9_9PLEO|nr:uncharacterized protein BDR25DRAFT_79790 [Lindgomyces ingoldianus]KAF2466153.1 hypothetical protein BDR25DRAFT_79790 [Lindgomyces ingoldianus]